jgi:hypothetical protein
MRRTVIVPARLPLIVMSACVMLGCATGRGSEEIAPEKPVTTAAISVVDAHQRLYAIADDSMGGFHGGALHGE